MFLSCWIWEKWGEGWHGDGALPWCPFCVLRLAASSRRCWVWPLWGSDSPGQAERWLRDEVHVLQRRLQLNCMTDSGGQRMRIYLSAMFQYCCEMHSPTSPQNLVGALSLSGVSAPTIPTTPGGVLPQRQGWWRFPGWAWPVGSVCSPPCTSQPSVGEGCTSSDRTFPAHPNYV